MTKRNKTLFTAVVLAAALAASLLVDAFLPSYHNAVQVIQKATVYALVAVSMNLLNGFTGLFSLGQAGFMLLGAYAYGVLGETVGTTVGLLAGLLVGGVLAALLAYLIGLTVLRLKSDYLAIATLGFAEILRAFFQWNALGPITNGSNLLKSYPTFSDAFTFALLIVVLCVRPTGLFGEKVTDKV